MQAPYKIGRSVCPYCTFGLPPKTRALWDKYDIDYDTDLHYGPGHVVFADENLTDESIRYCLDLCAHGDDPGCDRSKAVLLELLAIPECERCWENCFDPALPYDFAGPP